MALPDTAIITENNTFSEDLLITPPSQELIRPIASAAHLPMERLQNTFQELALKINLETSKELGLAKSSQSPFFIDPVGRSEAIATRIHGHDKPNLDFLLQSLHSFSEKNGLIVGENLPDPLDLQSGLELLHLHNSIYPLSPASTHLARLAWYVASLNNQWLFSDKSSAQMQTEMVIRFTDMAESIFSKDDAIRQDANRIYTDQDYVVEMLSNGIKFLQQASNYNTEPIIPPRPKVLVIGPGKGLVEGKILSQIGVGKDLVDAIDILSPGDIGDKWEGMDLIPSTDLLDFAKDTNNHNKYDLILCIGSTLVNHENQLNHLEYPLAVQKLLKDRGVYCYETRLLEADVVHNTALARSRSFTAQHPHRPPGVANSAHRLSHSDPEGFGASMQPWQLQRLVFDMTGLTSLNYPLLDPTSEERYLENLSENEFILNSLRHPDPSTHNPIKQPAWKAGDGNYRIAHFVQKTPNFDTTLAEAVVAIYSRSLAHPRRLL